MKVFLDTFGFPKRKGEREGIGKGKAKEGGGNKIKQTNTPLRLEFLILLIVVGPISLSTHHYSEVMYMKYSNHLKRSVYILK